METKVEEEGSLRRCLAKEEGHRSRRKEEEEAEPPRGRCPLYRAPQELLFAKTDCPARAAPKATVAAGRRRRDHTGEETLAPPSPLPSAACSSREPAGWGLKAGWWPSDQT